MVINPDNFSTIVDMKDVIWQVLYKKYKEVNANYPTLSNVNVEKGYPAHTEKLQKTNESDPPKVLVSVVLASNVEDIISVGDYAVSQSILQSAAAISGNYETDYGNLQSEVYEISTWSLNANARDKFGLVTRQILFNEKRRMHLEYGIYKIRLVSGRDEEVDTNQGKLPLTVFRRIYLLEVTNKINKKSIDELLEGLVVTEEIEDETYTLIS